jgi:2-oxoglutarate ferredoxin oxidoreductase subunit gamma
MSRTEIKIGGFGGQGVILTGMIIGRAAAIYEGRNATLTQSFGPEARGGACSAQLVITDEKSFYPFVNQPDVLVVMSQPACDKYSCELKGNGLALYESKLVDATRLPAGSRKYGIEATNIAESLGRRMVLNIVMLGFFSALCDVVKPDSVRRAIEDSVPPGTIKLNLDAFQRGFDLGQKQRAQNSF